MRQREEGENVNRNLYYGFCGKEQAGQVSRQRVGGFESFQLWRGPAGTSGCRGRPLVVW